ncbi:zinc knuckle CX2CX4HX4C [Artemisia annua]|uniref:Zinc knuckle CX2CX4HX4C n=1 Tax=Artemisia annua TaxID=35608 RepID=A0A2U1L370_ARTAN|nr:zinc knuckle CX2CX4HX4C [Artemisia annua]
MTRLKAGAGNSDATQPRKAARVVHNISVDTTKKDEGYKGSSGSDSLQTQALNSLKPVAASGDDYVFGTALDNSSSVAMAGTNSSSEEYPSLAAATGGVSNVASLGESLHQSIDANAPDGDGISVAPMAGRFKTVSSTSAQDKGPDSLSMPSVGLSQDSPMVQSVEVTKQPTSYVGATTGTQSAPTKGKSNFRDLKVDNVFNGVDVSIHRKVVETISTKFEHTLYGYFIGKRIAFPVVEYFVRNNWAKYGTFEEKITKEAFSGVFGVKKTCGTIWAATHAVNGNSMFIDLGRSLGNFVNQGDTVTLICSFGGLFFFRIFNENDMDGIVRFFETFYMAE